MSDEKHEDLEKTPEEESQEEPELDQQDLEDIMTSESGMTLRRMREIEEADKAGDPVEISPEEREQYEAAKTELTQALEPFRKKMMEPYEGISKQLRDIAMRSFQIPKPDIPKMKSPLFDPPTLRTHDQIRADALIQKSFVPQMPRHKSPEPAISQEQLDSIAEVAHERDERQGKIQDNTFETALAMQKMLDEMESESKKGATRWWWVFAVAVVTMLLAGVAALPIIGPFLGWW